MHARLGFREAAWGRELCLALLVRRTMFFHDMPFKMSVLISNSLPCEQLPYVESCKGMAMKSLGFCIFVCLQTLLGHCQQDSTNSPGVFPDRFRQSIKEFESEIIGKRNVFVSYNVKETIEISLDGKNVRQIIESRDAKDPYLVDYDGNYISVGLGQAVNAHNTDSRRSKEAIKIESFGVTFFKEQFAVLGVKGLCESLQFGVVCGRRMSDFFDESELSTLPSKGGSQGVLCRHRSGVKAEIWLIEDGRFGGVRIKTSPGDLLENGKRCPAGQWSRVDYRVEWTKEPQPRLTSFNNSVEANGGIKGSRVYKVIESRVMESQLGSLIDLESLKLKNGVSVSCAARPNNEFRFLEGRVVSIADDASVR